MLPVFLKVRNISDGYIVQVPSKNRGWLRKFVHPDRHGIWKFGTLKGLELKERM